MPKMLLELKFDGLQKVATKKKKDVSSIPQEVYLKTRDQTR